MDTLPAIRTSNSIPIPNSARNAKLYDIFGNDKSRLFEIGSPIADSSFMSTQSLASDMASSSKVDIMRRPERAHVQPEVAWNHSTSCQDNLVDHYKNHLSRHLRHSTLEQTQLEMIQSDNRSRSSAAARRNIKNPMQFTDPAILMAEQKQAQNKAQGFHEIMAGMNGSVQRVDLTECGRATKTTGQSEQCEIYGDERQRQSDLFKEQQREIAKNSRRNAQLRFSNAVSSLSNRNNSIQLLSCIDNEGQPTSSTSPVAINRSNNLNNPRIDNATRMVGNYNTVKQTQRQDRSQSILPLPTTSERHSITESAFGSENAVCSEQYLFEDFENITLEEAHGSETKTQEGEDWVIVA